MKRFEGQTVLVTGGRTGIGAACAERFAAEGAHVVCMQRGATDGFETVTVDFAELDSVEAATDLMSRVVASTGRLDVLVNNAGIMEAGSVEQMPLEAWQRTLHINLTVPFLLARAALPHLRAVNGNIVNVGSIEGLGANPGHPAYCASKAGLHGLTRAMAVDHGPENVRCNAVAPGWIDTDLNLDFIAAQPNATAFQERLAVVHPVGRTGAPSEVAALVAWLASDEAAFVTGQVYTVDGGRMTKLSLP